MSAFLGVLLLKLSFDSNEVRAFLGAFINICDECTSLRESKGFLLSQGVGAARDLMKACG